MGTRNIQGLALDPLNGRVWAPVIAHQAWPVASGLIVPAWRGQLHCRRIFGCGSLARDEALKD